MRSINYWFPVQSRTAGSHAPGTSGPLHPNRLLAERFLFDLLQVPWTDVGLEASRMGPAISPRVEARLRSLLDDPGTCPHGTPIPGSRNRPDSGALTTLPTVRGPGRIVRIQEHPFSTDVAALQRLEGAGVLPGRSIRVTSATRRWVELEVDRQVSRLPRNFAEAVLVKSEGVPTSPCDSRVIRTDWRARSSPKFGALRRGTHRDL